MIGTPNTLAALLAECEAVGICLSAEAGGLGVDGPPASFTPERLARLAAHKADLLAWLATTVPGAACRCGSSTWADVPIHGGRSLRRDCGRCGRFFDFPRWHGREA